jgi:D-alanyl-D-alanine carboxypeptidase
VIGPELVTARDIPESVSLNRRTLFVGLASVAALGAVTPAAIFSDAAFAWGSYQNGYIPLSAMTMVQYPGVNYWSWSSNPADGAVGAVYLESAAAAALISMLSSYHAATGSYLPVNEGYRSFAGQVYWQMHGSGGTPGESNHGWGRAIDFDWGLDSASQAQYNWVLSNAGRFGFAALGSGFGDFDYAHFNYTGAAGSGGDMPTYKALARTVPLSPLGVFTDPTNIAANQWTIVPYNNGTATNLAEQVPGSALITVAYNAYLTGLQSGDAVAVRLALWAKTSTDPFVGVTGKAMALYTDVRDGVMRINFTNIVQINQTTHRLAVQMSASSSAVNLTECYMNVSAW